MDIQFNIKTPNHIFEEGLNSQDLQVLFTFLYSRTQPNLGIEEYNLSLLKESLIKFSKLGLTREYDCVHYASPILYKLATELFLASSEVPPMSQLSMETFLNSIQGPSYFQLFENQFSNEFKAKIGLLEQKNIPTRHVEDNAVKTEEINREFDKELKNEMRRYIVNFLN